MKNYQILPHTADVRLLVQGTTARELFTVALEGMNKILDKRSTQQSINKNRKFVHKKISIESSDVTNLLIDFLNNILAKSLINTTIFEKVKFSKLENNHLQADIYGQKVDSFSEDIKAVTYHEAEIVRNEKGNYQTVIIFDI